MRHALLALAALAVAFPASVHAQLVGSGLVSTDAARQFGLDRMWFTQLSFNRGQGRAAGLHLHVSSTQAHTVFEVQHNGRRYVYSERDLDAFGKEIGVEGAKKKADERAAAIQEDLKAAGAADPPLPEVKQHVIPRITLYASSERGMVQAIDAETGQTRWSAFVGNPNYPTTAPAANDNHVAVCNGSTLYVLKAEDGELFWSRPTLGPPGAGPALTDEMLFVPMINGHIESFMIEEPKRPLATYKSFGRTMVQPVASYNSVVWPTDSGNLYVALAREPGLRYRMQARESIKAAPAFLPPDKLVTASLDGYVYCIGEAKGNVLWRFTTGEPVSHSPVALNDMVYIITDRGNLFAISADGGVEQWVAAGIRQYVAGNDKRIYCIDARGNLAILDAASGGRLGTLMAGSVDMPLMNVKTDRIILVSSTGLVQCFREAELVFPQLHHWEDASAEPQQPGTPTPTTPAPAAGAAPAADPFAAPAAADPFAAPAAPAADPFGAAPAADPPGSAPAADPFGTP